jgi:hypothetical protein
VNELAWCDASTCAYPRRVSVSCGLGPARVADLARRRRFTFEDVTEMPGLFDYGERCAEKGQLWTGVD